MNAVEIEEAISALAERSFEAEEFPFALLRAFGNKATTIRRLRAGMSNSSDLGGVLQRSNIHIKVCPEGEVVPTLAALKASPATGRARARFVLATDGIELHAEDLTTGDVVVCDYRGFPDHFGFLLPLAVVEAVHGEGHHELSQQRHPARSRPSARRLGGAGRHCPLLPRIRTQEAGRRESKS